MTHYKMQENWTYADIVRGHQIHPSSRKIQVIILVCHWIYDANGQQIEEIQKEKKILDIYVELFEKYKEYKKDYNLQMIECCFSGLTKGDKINIKILQHLENMDNIKLWNYYKGVYKLSKCRVCRNSFEFKYYRNIFNDIEMKFKCKCIYDDDPYYNHKIYQTNWIPQENLPNKLKNN